MKHTFILILFIICVFQILNSTNTTNLYNSAISAYQTKQFDIALDGFSQMEKQNIHNPDLFYNIGNCYFKMNRIGLAILYYKKALLYNSAHRLARKNLSFALKFTRDKQDYDQQNFLTGIILVFYNSLSLNMLSWILLILIILIVFMWHLLVRNNSENEITIRFLLVNTVILTFFIMIWCGMRYYHYENNNEAVVLASTVNGYSGPGEDFTKLFTIHEGLIVKLVKQEQGWTQISLPNGFSGWVRSSIYKPISNQE